MSIFKKIGEFFASLFDAAKRAYENLNADQQAALQNGTGLINLINAMTTNTPAEIRAAIQKEFPSLDEAQLESALFSIAKTLGLGTYGSVDDVINALRARLASLDGKEWATMSHLAASALSIAFAPKESKIAVITTLIEWVYQHFVKKATS